MIEELQSLYELRHESRADSNRWWIAAANAWPEIAQRVGRIALLARLAAIDEATRP